ncbi:MAG: response regulator [Actinomycetota bacterium]|nr:response regulator [Actinomycetota bacterium]
MSASGKLRIVLADDTAEYRQLLRLILEQDGRFDVVAEAADGAQAIELVVAERPDAIVLDLAMPVLDGLQAIPMLRERAPETAVVVLSGFARGQVDREAITRGAAAYVEKGEAFSTIVDTLLDVTGAAAVVG